MGTDRPQVRTKILRIQSAFACCMYKVTDVHSEYVILFAFSHQQWLLKRVSITTLYIRCLYRVFRRDTQTYCGFLVLLFLAFPVLSSLHVTRPVFQARRVTPPLSIKLTTRRTSPAIRNAWSCTCISLTLCAVSSLMEIFRIA